MLKKYNETIIIFLMVMTVCALVIACIISSCCSPNQALAEPIASIDVIEYIPEAPQPELQLEYIGAFTITGYCPCAICCGESNKNTASGTKPTAGRTVGADWATLPPGTEIYIEGYGYRTVEDKPADWIIERYNGKIIDVFCATHEEALSVGRQVVKVYKAQ